MIDFAIARGHRVRVFALSKMCNPIVNRRRIAVSRNASIADAATSNPQCIICCSQSAFSESPSLGVCARLTGNFTEFANARLHGLQTAGCLAANGCLQQELVGALAFQWRSTGALVTRPWIRKRPLRDASWRGAASFAADPIDPGLARGGRRRRLGSPGGAAVGRLGWGGRSRAPGRGWRYSRSGRRAA
jgi:hypothetical protein